MEINVRHVLEEDLQTIHDIDNAAFIDLPYPYFVLRQFFEVSEKLMLLAENANTPEEKMGYILGALHTGKEKVWLLTLAVHPDAQGRGVGSALTKAFLEEAALMPQVKEVWLAAEKDAKAALEIYQKQGFAHAYTKSNYHGKGVERILLRKKIND